MAAPPNHLPAPPTKDNPIGVLDLPNVYCHECRTPGEGVPLWEINVHPYSQTCHRCGKTLVAGNPGWVELYSKPLDSPGDTDLRDKLLAEQVEDLAEEDSAVMEEDSDEG